MEDCTHNCQTCSANCSSREQESLLAAPNPLSSVKKVIAVLSGKGGVGKSLVTSLMSILMQREGHHAAIMDADLTGPSIPRILGIKDKATGDENGVYPVASKLGIDVMSINLLLENDTDPVIWRGPVIAGTVKQFWTDVVWKDVDYMFVDMPPGTGDVPLTVLQSLPVDGVIVVTSPQELVSMIVEKAVKMAKMLNVPVLGIVENLSYFECPDCGGRHSLLGESHIEEVAEKFGVDLVAKIPMNPKLAAACDTGMLELFEGDWLDELAKRVQSI